MERHWRNGEASGRNERSSEEKDQEGWFLGSTIEIFARIVRRQKERVREFCRGELSCLSDLPLRLTDG